MKTKRHALALSLLMAMSSTQVAHAEESPAYKAWAGGFFELYNPDGDKTTDVGTLEMGEGFGLEYGFRFTERWATRIEWSNMELDAENSGATESAFRLGVDAMYFAKDDIFYLFAGVKNLDIDRAERVGNIGLGKHWKLNDKWRVITEAAMYHDFGQSTRDWGVKLGLAYIFGDTSSGPALPKDSDKDGVYDDRDQCPNTPVGTAVDSVGCNNDTDGDGVLNVRDKCPNTPAGTRVDADGCNEDKDGDGVLNTRDKCPDTPPGTKVGARGCSLESDSDQDGVLDQNDQCPETPLTDKVDGVGCSVFLEEEVSVSLQVLFANNSDVVANPEAPILQEFADFMARFPNTSAVIEGHSSAVGDAAYNQGLSERRARSVRNVLVNDYGVDAGRLSAVGYGETRLLDESDTESAHRKNRRIEAVVTAMEKVKAKR